VASPARLLATPWRRVVGQDTDLFVYPVFDTAEASVNPWTIGKATAVTKGNDADLFVGIPDF